MDRNRVKHPLDRRVAGLACGHRIVGHTLHDLEGMALLTAVFVDGHRFTKYSPGPLALWAQECQADAEKVHWITAVTFRILSRTTGVTK